MSSFSWRMCCVILFTVIIQTYYYSAQLIFENYAFKGREMLFSAHFGIVCEMESERIFTLTWLQDLVRDVICEFIPF